MVDLNSSLPVVTTVGSVIGNIMWAVSYMIGGLFGLYVVMFLHKIFTFKKYDRKIDSIVETLEVMSKKLDKINKEFTKVNAGKKKK
ncbi:hypothetical protein KY334_07370 [Candidatus Woesearchaeota archaeon]|nr:hypothetical protein [Candidatus Woesearchaeota archaeon]